MRAILNTDGGAKTGGVNGPTGGHSGPGSCSYVIRDEEGKEILERGGLFLEETTVPESEYSGVIAGLAACQRLGVTDVTLRADAQLIVMQINGTWACRAKNLRPYLEEVLEMADEFASFKIEWVPRHLNSAADEVGRQIFAENAGTA